MLHLGITLPLPVIYSKSERFSLQNVSPRSATTESKSCLSRWSISAITIYFGLELLYLRLHEDLQPYQNQLLLQPQQLQSIEKKILLSPQLTHPNFFYVINVSMYSEHVRPCYRQCGYLRLPTIQILEFLFNGTLALSWEGGDESKDSIP